MLEIPNVLVDSQMEICEQDFLEPHKSQLKKKGTAVYCANTTFIKEKKYF